MWPMQQISSISIILNGCKATKKTKKKHGSFQKKGVTLAQITLISAMRCNFNKEIRMEK